MTKAGKLGHYSEYSKIICTFIIGISDENIQMIYRQKTRVGRKVLSLARKELTEELEILRSVNLT